MEKRGSLQVKANENSILKAIPLLTIQSEDKPLTFKGGEEGKGHLSLWSVISDLTKADFEYHLSKASPDRDVALKKGPRAAHHSPYEKPRTSQTGAGGADPGGRLRLLLRLPIGTRARGAAEATVAACLSSLQLEADSQARHHSRRAASGLEPAAPMRLSGRFPPFPLATTHPRPPPVSRDLRPKASSRAICPITSACARGGGPGPARGDGGAGL